MPKRSACSVPTHKRVNAGKAMMFNDLSSPLALLLSRRSGKPRNLVAPGPDEAEIELMIAAATRVPDHGKLAPWRYVIVGADQRAALASVLVDAYLAEKPAAGRLEIEAMEQFAYQAPTLIVALSSPKLASKIPAWEQELSVGASCMQLLNSAHALGYGAGWLTGWPAYSDQVRNAFGQAEDRIAGFIFIGTIAGEQEERPRPLTADVCCNWTGTL
jgi:nitroreductase